MAPLLFRYDARGQGGELMPSWRILSRNLVKFIQIIAKGPLTCPNVAKNPAISYDRYA